ncbi:MAG: tRNA adenosine deaminase-associated protein [Carbonactinosporaceae bacterium]
MAYFAALLVHTDHEWVASDIEIDEIEDPNAMAALMRGAGADDRPVLLLIEQEDAWFAVVRVEGEDDPRVFVSDAAAVGRSAYGEVLLTWGEDVLAELGARPAGDDELLTDLGTPPEVLLQLCTRGGLLPADAISEIADRAGCADELESVR